jgi:hypothetical protein
VSERASIYQDKDLRRVQAAHQPGFVLLGLKAAVNNLLLHSVPRQHREAKQNGVWQRAVVLNNEGGQHATD